MQNRSLRQHVRKTLRSLWGRVVGAPDFSIIVFQMGKVGSRTVYESLARAYRKLHQPVDIYHSHILCNFENAEAIIRKERPNPEPSLGAIAYGKELRKIMAENPDRKWKIISLVRDPVARNIGTFFDNLHEFIPDWYKQKQDDLHFVQQAQNVFIEIQSIHSEPVRWFDEQLLPMFGVDVFSKPFPRDTGYKIYHPNSKNSILIIRLEDLDRIGSLAMKEFLGLNNFELINANIGDEKAYAELYRLFKQYPLPDKYIHQMYNTKYARTFYTEADIARFSAQWRKSYKHSKNQEKIRCDPIIVYQMGKVGSKTVEYSLIHYYQEHGIEPVIYHAHFLNYLDEMEKNAIATQQSIQALQKIHEAQVLREKIKKETQQTWHLVSLVRDPVARNIAGFFQNLSINPLIPNWRERFANGRLSLQDLQRIFLSLGDDYSQLPANWFDTQVKPVLSIDVFETPFPYQAGYKILPTKGNIRLLIIRAEDLSRCASQAMFEYLGLKNFIILNSNIGREKDYADVYNEFKQLPLPLEYVNKIYDTKYAQHFYSAAELDALKIKWTKKHP